VWESDVLSIAVCKNILQIVSVTVFRHLVLCFMLIVGATNSKSKNVGCQALHNFSSTSCYGSVFNVT
jgi:hypothetical protein